MSDDAIALTVLAVFFGGPILAMFTGAGDGVATWLTTHGVLTRVGVLVELGGGAGLDLARLAIAAGVLLALLAWAIHARRRRRALDSRPS